MNYIVRNYWKEYGLIWIINLLAIGALFIWTPFSNRWAWASLTLSEIILLFKILVQPVFMRKQHSTIIYEHGDYIAIKGIFTKLEVKKADIESCAVGKDFVSRINDWSKLTITTKSSRMTIYTKEITGTEQNLIGKIFN